MGTGIETFRTERARRRWQEPAKDSTESLQRAWSEVSKVRVVLGLAAAPLFPCAVFWTWLGVTSKPIDLSGFLLTSIVSTTLGICWFIGVGSLFLVLLGRAYGVIGRFNCLALCATLTFSMPLVSTLIGIAMAPFMDISASLSAILESAFSGLILAPFGIIGGWGLWRIAIRPAARPLEEIAEVF
jgi:hypothetical protein